MSVPQRKSSFSRRTKAPSPQQLGKDARAIVQQHLGEVKTLKNPAGRPKGARDKVPTELRQAVLDAGNLAGFDTVVEDMFAEQMELLRKENPEAAKKPHVESQMLKKIRKLAQGELTDYLRKQAKINPTAYMSLLGKVLPKQIDMNVQLTAREVISEMTERRQQLADMRASVVELADGVDYHAEDD